MATSRPFEGRSQSGSSFCASLLQAIDGMVSLSLCPQVVSRAPQHFTSSFPPDSLLGHFPSLRHVLGSTPPRETDSENRTHSHNPRRYAPDLRALSFNHLTGTLRLRHCLHVIPRAARLIRRYLPRTARCLKDVSRLQFSGISGPLPADPSSVCTCSQLEH